MRCAVDLDAQRDAAVHRHRQRLRAAHPAEARGQRDRAGQRAAEAPARDLGEALVGALHDALRADVDPRARGHLPVHRQPERPRAGGTPPRSPTPGTRFELAISTRGAHSCVRNTPTGLPDCTSSVSSSPERAQRAHDRVERLPRARRAAGAAVDDEVVGIARPPRGRGCSSASAAPPPAASPGRTSSVPRGARTSRAPSRQRPRSRPRPRPASAPLGAPAPRPPRARAPASGRRPGPPTRSRSARQRGGAVPRAGRSGARRSSPRAGARSARRRGSARGCRPTMRSLRAAAQPIDTWSSCIALVGSESTLAGRGQPPVLGHHRRLRVLGDHQARVDAGVVGEERRQAVRAGRRRAGGRCGARRSRRPRRRRWRGSRSAKPSGAPWKLPHDSTRPSGRTIGLSIADSQLGRRRPRSAWASASRAAPCTCGAQRSE